MTGLATASAYLLAALFVVAAASKLASPARTAAAFGALRLPAPRVLAVGVPVVELAVAVALIVAPSAGGIAALVVLAAFSVVVARALVTGASAPCACFGRHRSENVSAVDLARNAMLAVLAVVALGADQPGGVTVSSVALVGAVVVAGNAVLAVLRRTAHARRLAGRPSGRR